ncbi:hypothetical protein C0991_009561, partial [Blastosporella zonata]
MNFFKRALDLKPSAPALCPIIISQYKRDDYSADNPEQLHWAPFVVVTHTDSDQSGPVWQVLDRRYRDGSFTWELATNPNIKLNGTTKCLGGVCIGYVAVTSLEEFGN